MKYKVKESIAGCDAGTIIDYIDIDGGVILIEGKSLGYILDVIKYFGIHNKELFEKIEEKNSEGFVFEKGRNNYYITADLSTEQIFNSSCDRFEFETEEQAKKFAKKLKALREIKKWIINNGGNYQFTKGKRNWCIVYRESSLNHIESRFIIAYDTNNKYMIFNLYFSTEEKAQQCLEELKEEWTKLYYLD